MIISVLSIEWVMSKSKDLLATWSRGSSFYGLEGCPTLLVVMSLEERNKRSFVVTV